MIDDIIKTCKNIYFYAKDKNSKYLFCSESVAEIAGVDSPAQMIGKTDHSFVWKPHVHLFHSDDATVMHGKPLINILRPQVQLTRVAMTLGTKLILTGKDDNPIGVSGYHIDITGHTITKNNGCIDPEKNIFLLGEHFSNEYLTRREFEVFKYLLLGKCVEEITLILHRSVKTIQAQIKSIVNKLQCSHKSEIVPTAVKYGLTHVLNEFYLA